MIENVWKAAFERLQSPDFWTQYHLMDFLEVALLFWTILLIRKTLREIQRDNRDDGRDFRDSLRNSRYDAMDHLYFEINAQRIANPDFSTPNKIVRGSERWASYGAYAFIVWNFVETICDKIKDDRELRETWAPIILTEAAIHGGWLSETDSSGSYVNKISFKPCFFQFGLDLITVREKTGTVTQKDLNSLIDKLEACNRNPSVRP